MKIFGQNLVEKCNTNKHVTKNGTGRHDVISRIAGTNVDHSQGLKIIKPTLAYSSRNRKPSWQNVLNSIS